MTPVEIAYFKHFMYDKGLERLFQFFYRKNRIKGSPAGDKDANPILIEQFLLQTKVEDVLMKAFTFYPSGSAVNENATFDYWAGINKQWQQYISAMSGNIINDSWPLLIKTFAILRQNWDVPSYWRRENLESTEEVYKRMNIDLPLPEFCWHHGTLSGVSSHYFDILNANDGDIIVRVRRTKNGSWGRTFMIVKNVAPYNPDESDIKPEQLHCEWNPEKGNISIAYLYAAYNIFGADLRTNQDKEIHAVIDANDASTKYRLASDNEVDVLIHKLAEAGIAWNPTSKSIVPLSAAKEEEPPLIDFIKDDDSTEIDFVEFEKRNYALSRGKLSVNTRNHSWRVTVNRSDTKDIRQKKLKYAMVGKTKAGDTMIVFCNNDKGIPITYNNDSYYNINSRQFCEHLIRLLSITNNFEYLNIEKVSESINSITYKVQKQ